MTTLTEPNPNDTFPTAMHISSAEAITNDLIPSLRDLRDSLAAKSEEWSDIVKRKDSSNGRCSSHSRARSEWLGCNWMLTLGELNLH